MSSTTSSDLISDMESPSKDHLTRGPLLTHLPSTVPEPVITMCADEEILKEMVTYDYLKS